jgi:hypothetical protein
LRSPFFVAENLVDPDRPVVTQWSHCRQNEQRTGKTKAKEIKAFVYFLTGPEGQWELSDGEQQIGHMEQVGLAFEIKPLAGSILDGMEAQPYPSKQEALRAIELHTGRSCEPAVTQT